jgi:hypothetical protein
MKFEARITARNSRLGHAVHARLLVRREGEWHVAGVFQLRHHEWVALASVCEQFGVDIERESGGPEVEAWATT